MKKILLLTWVAFACLLLTNTTANGQSSRSSVMDRLEKILSKKEEIKKDRPPVSRKRTPGTVPSRKREPGQTREPETDQRSGEENRKREPVRTKERETGQSPRQETQKRRRSEDYPSRERAPQQRNRTDDRDWEEGRPGSNTKAKCGVPGCQHPGKHKGLHKHQNVVRPIRSGQ